MSLSSTDAPPPSLPPTFSAFSGYFKKSIDERRQLLLPHLLANNNNKKYDIATLSSFLSAGLDVKQADHMVENCIGTLALPLGVAPTFLINQHHYLIPMCTEEPSVIAAASAAAKLIAEAGGGFTTHSTPNIMHGQIQLLQLQSCELAIETITKHRDTLIQQANQFCLSMVKRGGGVVDVYAETRYSTDPRRKQQQPIVVVFIKVDVCDSMGANIINTVCEGVSPLLVSLLSPSHPNVRAGLRILTNLCVSRRACSRFRLPFSCLGYKGVAGHEVAQRIVEAYHFACDDEYRAVTNNKGILNGIDAVALATGQDWRAIEAAAHAWAAVRNHHKQDSQQLPDRYGPLAEYHIEYKDAEEREGWLVGEMDIPISVGVAGGALSSHPVYQFSLSLLGSPDAQTLAGVMVSVGLAQNFAAIRALSIEGIQKGHMALHAKNIAAAAGATEDDVQSVAAYLVACNRINKQTASEYLTLKQTYLEKQAHTSTSAVATATAPATALPPSTLFVEVATNPKVVEGGVVRARLLFPSVGELGELHLCFSGDSVVHPLQSQLFGEYAGDAVNWLTHSITQAKEGQPYTPAQAEYAALENLLAAIVSSSSPSSPSSIQTLIASLQQVIKERMQHLQAVTNTNSTNDSSNHANH